MEYGATPVHEEPYGQVLELIVRSIQVKRTVIGIAALCALASASAAPVSAPLYVSYARGFKAGGFNPGDITAVAANIPFAPEHVNAYEVGVKSEWLEERLLVNLAVFRSEYSDLQVSINQITSNGTFISLVRNAAASISQGAEFETRWAVSRQFRLSANASYLDAYYADYLNGSPTSAQTLIGQKSQDLSGRPTEYASKLSGSAVATYTTPVAGLPFTTEVGVYAARRSYLDPTDDDLLQQHGYARLDARLGLESADGHWAVDVIGKNLADREIRTFVTNQPTALGSLLVQNQQPRNVALQFRYHW